jgi:hypothetical protein
MQPCQCHPAESPFTCARSGCEMTARQHELCSGVNCTARQHVKHARLFAGQRCGEHIGDVNKMVDHVAGAGEMVRTREKQRNNRPAKNGAEKVPKQLRSFGPAPQPVELAPCIHRGDKLRDTTCKPCLNAGRKSVEVWSCAIHGECVARRGAMSGAMAIRACLTCGDYVAEETRKPPEERLPAPEES